MRTIIRTTLLSLVGLALSVSALRAQSTAQSTAQSAADTTSVAAAAELPLSINEMRRQRGLTDIHNLFVPKGQWIFGGTASYSTHTNKNHRVLVIEEINSRGYTFKASPVIAYAFRDNMAAGGRFIYSRSLTKIDKAKLAVAGLDFSANNFYALTHKYEVAAIWRQYIPLGRNKRFALFNEMQLSVGGHQSKFANDSPVQGTFASGYTLALGISPGIVAFATNNMSVEVNVGVMGISYTHTKQVHNQVREGTYDSSMMNFKVNIFSIGLGMVFYL